MCINHLIYIFIGSYGRAIKDKSYFLGELKQKISLLSNELNTLNLEYENVTKENSNIATFEKKQVFFHFCL